VLLGDGREGVSGRVAERWLQWATGSLVPWPRPQVTMRVEGPPELRLAGPGTASGRAVGVDGSAIMVTHR
jgi:hypothetical protein